MSTQSRHDPAALSPALRFICGFNAAIWLVAKPPWFQSDALSTSSAVVGALMWLLLGIGGNRAGWARRATLVAAVAYTGLLLATLVLSR